MARPALVDMRRLNPWVFARLRVFGWYVRFTSICLSPPGRIRVAAARRDPPTPNRGSYGAGRRSAGPNARRDPGVPLVEATVPVYRRAFRGEAPCSTPVDHVVDK